MAPRTIIYIDGFNLYYGALKDTPYKWLNYEKYFQLIRPHDDIVEIKFFTATVTGRSKEDQKQYLGALSSCQLVSIILGKFKLKDVLCRVKECRFGGDRKFKSWEEKTTDVNIAVHMINDAYKDFYDQAILVTNDSDLVPPLEMIKAEFPKKKLIVYVPAKHPKRRYAVELKNAADKMGILPIGFLPRCQFPPEVPKISGSGFWTRPKDW